MSLSAHPLTREVGGRREPKIEHGVAMVVVELKL